MLPIPFNGTVEYTEWREEVNPYERVAPMISSTSGTIFVDGAIRHFIVDGLQKAFPLATIVTAPPEVRQLRERKSDAELGLMKCANEVSSHIIIIVVVSKVCDRLRSFLFVKCGRNCSLEYANPKRAK